LTETGSSTRRRPRERDTRIDALTAAALDELREHGYDGLTVRNAARRAGIAPATAYTYFGSKDHLVAEVFWRRLQLLTPPSSRRASAVNRLTAALDNLVDVIAGDPALIAASTTAVLADDPDVADLRDRISARIAEHLATALGADAEPTVLRVLNLAVSGALLQAGMGFLPRDQLTPRLHEVARLLLTRRS
jgi:AcrR family transcriptional regulator